MMRAHVGIDKTKAWADWADEEEEGMEEDEEGVGELEEHVPEARIRKMQSVRTFNPKVHWRKLKDVIRASRAFGMFALKSTTLVPAAAS